MGDYLNLLGLFLSGLYITMNVLSLFWFMDAFGMRRCTGKRFVLYLAGWGAVEFVLANILLSGLGIVQTLVNLAVFVLAAWWMYPSIHRGYRVMLAIVLFVTMYLVDFGIGILCAAMLGMDIPAFNQTVLPVVVRGVGSSLFILLLCAVIKRVRTPAANRRLRWEYLLLTLLFPLASLAVLLVFLQVAIKEAYYSWPFVFCTIFLAVANLGLLALLNRMEKGEQTRQKQLALEQTLQLQAKNMEALSGAYSRQRKMTHDFNACLNTLETLLQNREWEAAQSLLQAARKKQAEQSLLVNSRHPILDAVLNQKAYEAQKNHIDLHLEVNDLSRLALDPVDITAIFANLLDNAIEACIRYKGEKRLEVKVILQENLFFSVRNTSEPVRIQNNCIATTKPDPQLHGFGLENVKAILQKYSGDFSMQYQDGWFLFAGELENRPIS